MNTEIQHDGEYVLTKAGSKDFGEIPEEIAKVIKHEKGKIRLRTRKSYLKNQTPLWVKPTGGV